MTVNLVSAVEQVQLKHCICHVQRLYLSSLPLYCMQSQGMEGSGEVPLCTVALFCSVLC